MDKIISLLKTKDITILNNSASLSDITRRVFDILASLISLILLCPLLLLLAIMIKVTGRGPVIYTQDRIGRNGKPFVIYKFRSMVFNAEKDVPLLSNLNEERITRIGKFLRKYRIDEIPNFINVIRGEMSIVGPRPERSYFIDQILKRAPEFSELQKVKPGITSWGQVMYGYASNIDEMIERLEYDLYYMKHKSAFFDLKIILFTFRTILSGKGL